MTRFDFFRPMIMPSPYTKYKEFQPAPFLRPYICCYWLASLYKMQVPFWQPFLSGELCLLYKGVHPSDTIKM